MAGFNNKFKVSNNYIAACKNKNKLRVYKYSDGWHYFKDGVKTPISEGDVIDGKVVKNLGEFHHSKNKYGFNDVYFWELLETGE